MYIRTAEIKDIKFINELYKNLFETMEKLQPKYIKSAFQDEEFIKNTIEKEEAEIFVAIEEDKIKGFLLIQEQETPPYTCMVFHKYAYITDLIVNTEDRGKGIGTMLLNFAKEWARKRNLDYIELGVLNNNDRAIKLYKKENFKKTMYIMRMEI